MTSGKPFIWALVAAAAAWSAHASDQPAAWHLIVARGGARTSIRMADGAISEVQLGGGERAALGPNMAGATRTVMHVLSPDGRRILYEMARASKPEYHFLAIADADGKNFRLIGSEGNNICPAWSPDGRHVLFLSKRAANKDAWHVYRIEVDSGDEKQMSREPVSSLSRPCFAADGRVIFAIDRRREGKLPLMDLVISDGQKDTVLVKKNYVISSSTSPNGAWLAVIVPGELSIRDLKRDQVQSFPMKDVNPNWHVTYHGVLWRRDNRALALTFGFLGGKMRGARIEGEDHVAVLSLDGAKPTITTYRVGDDQSLYAWVTEDDMKRKK